MTHKPALFFILFAGLISGCSDKTKSSVKGKEKKATQYELVKDWPDLPPGYKLGSVSGIDIDSNQNVVLIHRAWRQWKDLNEIFPDTPISANTVLILEKNTGKILKSWGANFFIMPHGLAVDNKNQVWITDVGLQQVFKFSHDGKLLMKLGEAKIPGNDSLHFNYPTDVTVSPDGSFYVSDGYRNSRVIKFSKEGKYRFEWGRKGNGNGEFNTPHAIDLDSDGNVYVADRENDRIQKFDPNGRYITQWRNNVDAPMYSLTVDTRNNKIFAVDYLIPDDSLVSKSDVLLFDSAFIFLNRFGRSGSYKGPVCWYHDISIDNEGSLYVGDIFGKRIQKFRVTTD